jgi:hypothetical protein
VDLPTYTNIWRIEKRLYKLYDFRLPAPLPITWIAVFAGITIPYIVLLVAIGVPFNHTLVWLYVLPPGVLTWLTTRPVIENKRLPELLESQIRYLTEPRVWCRLTPLGEKDQVVVTARVWHSRRAPQRRTAGAGTVAGALAGVVAGTVALRDRGTLIRRNRGATAPPVAAAVTPEVASWPAGPVPTAPAAVGSALAESAPAGSAAASALPARPRVRSRVRGTGPQGPVSGPATRQRRPASKTWLTGLGSRPASPAPTLSPGSTPKPPAGPPQPRPDTPAQHRARLARELPAARSVTALGSVAAPVQSVMPAHAAPDVHPMTTQTAPAQTTAAPDTAPVRAETAPVQAPTDPEAGAGTPPMALRVRGASPPIEVSHGGSVERPAPPAPLPPANPALAWPVPARPLRPAQPAPRASADPSPVSAAITTGNGDKSEASQAAPAAPRVPVVKAVTDTQERAVPSIERALSGPSKHRNLSWHGTVKIVAGGTQGPGARDQEALDRTRARLPLRTPKRVLVLGCTSGAGQSLTTLMTGYILASLREHPVAAVDLHDGTLARYSPPAGRLEEILLGKPPRSQLPARPDGLHPARMTAPAKLDVIASNGTLRDGDEMKLAAQLGRHYPLTMLDPGGSGLTRLLKVTDQLVVVVPASVEAAGALADTRDWLDAHGFADLAGDSVTLINGVSRRSLGDVEQAESVAHGRCRAIVRVPWDEMLPSGLTSPATLRTQTRVAYTALAGVLVAGLAAAPVRTQQ